MTVDKAFLSLLNMSLTTTFVITVVVFTRLALKRAPKWISYVLWAVVLFNLLCPFRLESVFCLNPLKPTPIPLDISVRATPRIDSGVPIINNAVNAILPAAVSDTAPAASVNPLQIWIIAGAYIWIIGIAALLIYAVVTFARLKHKLRFATKKESDVYETDRIRSPFVLGFVRPKVYLPVGLSDVDLAYILCHERTHIKRRDYLVKPIAFLALAIHWFNPLVWLAYFLLNADMEMSCDERTLNEMGGDIKAMYSNALLALSTGKRLVGLSSLAFGEGGIKERVRNVLKFKKTSRVIIVAAVALVIVLSVGFAVSKANPLDADETEQTHNYTAQLIQETYIADETEQTRDYAAQLIQETYTLDGNIFSDNTDIVVTLWNGDILKKTYSGWYMRSSYLLYADLTSDGVDEIILALQIGGSNYNATEIHVLSIGNGVLTEILTIMEPGEGREIAYKDSLFVIPLILDSAESIPSNELEHYYSIYTGVECVQTTEGYGLLVQHLIKKYDVIPYSVILWNGTEWFVANQGVSPLSEPLITAPPNTVLAQISHNGYDDGIYLRENGYISDTLNTVAFADETVFLKAIKDKLLNDYAEIAFADWTQEYGKAMAKPNYLPERFKYYDGLFIKDNPGIPGNTMTAQLWYDPQTFEILTVTQSEIDGQDSAGIFVFSDKLLDGGTVQSVFPWASYVASFPVDRSGMSIYGYMLVSDENQKDECEKLLTSLAG